MTIIKDGTGSGRSASVNADNQLETYAESIPSEGRRAQEEAGKGESLPLPFGQLPDRSVPEGIEGESFQEPIPFTFCCVRGEPGAIFSCAQLILDRRSEELQEGLLKQHIHRGCHLTVPVDLKGTEAIRIEACQAMQQGGLP